MKNTASILIVDYGDTAWKQYGTTEQFHLFPWSDYQTLGEYKGDNGNETLTNMGITSGKRQHQASTNELNTIITIAETLFYNDRKYVGTKGNIYLFGIEQNTIQAI